MTTMTHRLHYATQGFSDVHDLTADITRLLGGSKLHDGLLTVFVPGSTAGITTIEYEPGVVEDLRQALERLVPRSMPYRHDARWGDGNGFAHVRASLIGPSLTIPFHEKELLLGTWQQVVLIDFDNHPRDREVAVHILGE
jgi:secondary thiamine-phosphate synthase enzyme